jgi:hypothetical protein
MPVGLLINLDHSPRRVSPSVSSSSLPSLSHSDLCQPPRGAALLTRCTRPQEFVKTIRKTCGNVHELGTIAAPCHNMLEEHAREFGCCWETVMKAYKQLDPQAHHSWRMWQGTVSGKAGIVFDRERLSSLLPPCLLPPLFPLTSSLLPACVPPPSFPLYTNQINQL